MPTLRFLLSLSFSVRVQMKYKCRRRAMFSLIRIDVCSFSRCTSDDLLIRRIETLIEFLPECLSNLCAHFEKIIHQLFKKEDDEDSESDVQVFLR